MIKVNDNPYIRHRPLTNRDFESENIKIRCNFPQILEMRISFASCRKLMTYNNFMNQPVQATERKLYQNLAKDPELIIFLNRFSFQPYIPKYEKYSNLKLINVFNKNYKMIMIYQPIMII